MKQITPGKSETLFKKIQSLASRLADVIKLTVLQLDAKKLVVGHPFHQDEVCGRILKRI